MTLEAALEERNMKASELIRRSGMSAPTIYNITSPNKEPYKTGVKADTLAKIAETLNAIIVIDANKPFLFDIILKEGEK
jgi:predicted transcriptional regulator